MKQRKLSIGRGDRRVFLALLRYHYMLSDQISRLCFLPSYHATVQSRLKELWEHSYLLRRTCRGRGAESGRAPFAYGLARGAFDELEKDGYEVPPRFRPSEMPDVAPHHILVNDFMIAAERFTRDTSGVELAHLVHDRDLQRQPSIVEYDRERIRVVPDAWLDFHVRGEERICISLELDRDTEKGPRWKEKVRGIVAWANGPYREAFGTDSLTVAVVTTGSPRRLAELRRWTEEELVRLRQSALGDIFLFTNKSVTETHPVELFTSPIFLVPYQPEPVALIT